MKLYKFSTIRKRKYGPFKIVKYEIEADEKEKTYVYGHRRIKKDAIGKVERNYLDLYVFLLEDDSVKVAKLFMDIRKSDLNDPKVKNNPVVLKKMLADIESLKEYIDGKEPEERFFV